MITGVGTFLGNYLGKTGLGYLQKGNVQLRVSSFEIQGKDYGNIRGFQILCGVRNDGKRIATKLTLSASVAWENDPPKFTQVKIETKNGGKSYTREKVVERGQLPYEWDTERNGSLKPWEELKKGDEAFARFPSETIHGVAIGTVGPGRSTFYGSEYYDIIEFKPGNYSIHVDVKAEDPYTREIVTATWKKNLDLTKEETYAIYWLGTKQNIL